MNNVRIKKHGIRKSSGFTLIEMLVVIGLIALLATSVLVAVNPSRQFKFARDTQRKAHLATILNAIGQNMSEHEGVFICDGVAHSFPQGQPAFIKSGSGSSTANLAPCLVPTYLSKMPFDPSDASALYTDNDHYETMYKVVQDSNGHLTLTASSEIDPDNAITITR
jgi:prepilin-type N-terminal cleavage/methylation domain-containing protein